MSGVVVGLGAALAVGAPFRLDTALGCLAVALLLQITANLANDLSDFRKGADTPGPDRARPGRRGRARDRAPARGRHRARHRAGRRRRAVADASSAGRSCSSLGVLAVVAALAYTGGPWPYGYRGLGEVFVFVFFGLVAVVGTAYLQAGRLEPLFVAAAMPVGALTTAILVVNNLRDIPTDAAAGKRTLAVILGARATRLEYGAPARGRLRRAGRRWWRPAAA